MTALSATALSRLPRIYATGAFDRRWSLKRTATKLRRILGRKLRGPALIIISAKRQGGAERQVLYDGLGEFWRITVERWPRKPTTAKKAARRPKKPRLPLFVWGPMDWPRLLSE